MCNAEDCSDNSEQTVGVEGGRKTQFEAVYLPMASVETGAAQEDLRSYMKQVSPGSEELVKKVLTAYAERYRSQIVPIMASIPKFTLSITAAHSALGGFGISPETKSMLRQLTDQYSAITKKLAASLEPLFYPELLRGLNARFLPPNLRDYADEIQASQVHQFLKEEGIPLYLVPRGRTAVRLLRAQDRSARRRVLSDCYESIIKDCVTVLEQVDHDVIGDEINFVFDGIGAMRAGYTRSAQSMFTVTLDTLISRFFPDIKDRKYIINRKKEADVPDIIKEMAVHKAMVWLPIWNAHEEFWKHKGHKTPRYYCRHASVHSVSSRQFSKRNCVQALMLVTSLIGYAERFPPSKVLDR